MKRFAVRVVTVLALASLAAGTAAASRHANGTRIYYRIGEPVFGRSYADWSIAWARFEWASPASQSPLLHPLPCRHLVVGHVFFLPGPGKGQTIVCRVPAGDAVYVPTASGFEIHTTAKDTKQSLRRQAVSTFAQTKVVNVTVDGKAIDARQFRQTTPFFSVDLSSGNLMQVPAGAHRAIQSGYNFILKPLAAGRHTVAMHIRIASGGKTLYEARTRFMLHVS